MEKPELTEDEVKRIKEIQSKTQQVITTLGEIELLRIQLSNQYKQQEVAIEEINKLEMVLDKELNEKYGESNPKVEEK